MNNLDYVFIIILVLLSVRGLRRGLINEVFGFGSFVLSLLMAILFYARAAVLFQPKLNEVLSKVCGFLAVFIVVFIVVKIVQMIVKAIFSGAILKSLDRSLGLLLGFVEGAAIVFVLLFMMQKFNPQFDTQELREKSVISNIVKEIPV